MKKKRLLLSILSLIFAGILLSCDDDDEGSSIEISKSSISIDIKGGKEIIELTANDDWEVRDIPEWISVSPASGNSSAEITILAEENNDFARRKVSLIFMCKNENKALEIEQLGLTDETPFIELSKNVLAMNITGEEQKIKITTNRAWKVTNAPEWVSVNPATGNGSSEIIIRIAENRNPENRQIMLKFVAEDIKDTLHISQFGLRDVIRAPGLPIFPFQKMEFTHDLNNYKLHANSLFVNPDIRNKIYLGNLISHNAQSNTHIPEFTGYTFNPITISTSAMVSGELVKTYTPSLTEQDAFAKGIAEQEPKQNLSFIADNGTIEFYTHKQLYALGMINMGIKLDEVVSGYSFTQKEMTKKYGLIFSFKQTLFSLDMDLPENLVKEELKEEDKKTGVSYVHSVSYGRVGLLVVESDTDSRDVRIAINKVIADQPLSQEETDLLSTTDAYYIYFRNNEVQVEKGNSTVIDAYKEAIISYDPDDIYPVGFQLADYSSHSISTISFILKIPE